jgi:acetyltransferase-like isoleucine patch superfamily enzyme
MTARLKEFFLMKIVCRNNTVRYARRLGVTIGDQCRLLDHPRRIFGTEPYLVSLGHHVTITSGVRFVTHDGGVWVFREDDPEIDVFGPIRIGNNVFIGFDTLVLLNVTIGDNCVIGAGSLVTRSIPSNTVAAGCPARPLKSLEEYRKKVEPLASHLRSLPKDRKREALLRRFGRCSSVASQG